jgi:hypothetical protein
MVPERVEPSGSALGLGTERRLEIVERLAPMVPLVLIVRIRALDGIPQDRDELRVGDVALDPRGGFRRVEVDDRRFTHGALGRHACEERAIALDVDDRVPLALLVPGATECRYASFVGEEPRLLVLRHEHVRVLPQVVVQRRGAALRRTDDEEIRERQGTRRGPAYALRAPGLNGVPPPVRNSGAMR